MNYLRQLFPKQALINSIGVSIPPLPPQPKVTDVKTALKTKVSINTVPPDTAVSG